MRRRRLRLPALTLLLCFGVMPAFADDLADCNQQKDLDLRIRGCGAVLQSPQLRAGDKAVVYQLRANALRAKREFSAALADYNEALTLADDEVVRRSIESGMMMALTQGPPELRSTPVGRRAVDLLEKSFQKSKGPRPASK